MEVLFISLSWWNYEMVSSIVEFNQWEQREGKEGFIVLFSGTAGRVCNRTGTGSDSCKNLCCNRGYTTKVIKSQNRCNCKFVWCCQVVCKQCQKVEKFDICN